MSDEKKLPVRRRGEARITAGAPDGMNAEQAQMIRDMALGMGPGSITKGQVGIGDPDGISFLRRLIADTVRSPNVGSQQDAMAAVRRKLLDKVAGTTPDNPEDQLMRSVQTMADHWMGRVGLRKQ